MIITVVFRASAVIKYLKRRRKPFGNRDGFRVRRRHIDIVMAGLILCIIMIHKQILRAVNHSDGDRDASDISSGKPGNGQGIIAMGYSVSIKTP